MHGNFRTIRDADQCASVVRRLVQVLPEHRNQAKALAYGVLYGMGHARLADGLKCSLAEAKEHQDAFMRALPGLVRPPSALA